MDTKKELLLGTIISYCMVAVQILSTLILTPFLLSQLGDNEYGIYKIISALIAYLSVLNFGWGNALIRFLSELRAKKEFQKSNELISLVMILNIFSILAAALLGTVLYFNIPLAFSQTLSASDLHLAQSIFMILVASVAFTILTDFYTSFIYVYEKFVYVKLLELLKHILRMFLLFAIIRNWKSAIFVAIVDLVVSVFVLLMSIYYCIHVLRVKAIPKLNWKTFHLSNYYSVLQYAMLFFFNMLIEQLIWNTDSIIIGMKLNTHQVSIFSSGAAISAGFNSMVMIMNSMLFPKIVKDVTLHRTEDYSTHVMIRIGRIQAFIASYVFVGYYILGNVFVRSIWLGEEYQLAWTTSIIVMVGILFSSLTTTGHMILRAINRQLFFLMSYFIIFLINAVCTYFVVGKYGIVAAAVATTLSYVIGVSCFVLPYYKRVIHLKISVFVKSILPIILTTTLLGIIAKYFVDKWNIHSSGQFVLGAVLYTGAYCIMALFLLMSKEEKEILKSLTRRIVKK